MMLVGLSVACDDSEPRSKEFENEGSACVVGTSDAGMQDVVAGRPAHVRVVFSDCESYCAKVTHASCDVHVEGDVISVTASATLEQERDDSDCPTECRRVEATCRVGSLEEGTYTFKFGDESRSLEVPGSDYEACSKIAGRYAP